jgi:hypothetical protein
MDKKVTTIGGARSPEQASATALNEMMRKAAAALGRKGGLVKSEAKQAACRRNIGYYNAVRTASAMSPAERKARRKAQRAARRLNR